MELHAFVSAATKELMWLNEKEEEEVNYDWSDKNSNMASKKESYSVSVWRRRAAATAWHHGHKNPAVPRLQGLMRELELREKKVNSVQASGDRLLRDGHPARPTIEVRRRAAPHSDVEKSTETRFPSAGVHYGAADAVELAAAALLLHRDTPEGEHRLLPGMLVILRSD